jgi:hypothetical protein
MPRIFTLVTMLALAVTMEMGSVVVAKAQMSSAMNRCVAACQKHNGKRCEHWCEGRTAGHQ